LLSCLFTEEIFLLELYQAIEIFTEECECDETEQCCEE